MDLSPNEITVFRLIREQIKGGRISENEIVAEGLNLREISSSISWLEKKGLVRIETIQREKIRIGREGEKYLVEGLPELRLVKMLKNAGPSNFERILRELGKETGTIAITQFSKLGIKPKSGMLNLADNSTISEKVNARQNALEFIASGNLNVDQEILDNFRSRGNMLEIKRISSRIVSLTDEGETYRLPDSSELKIEEIDRDVITSGIWKGRSFRTYDLESPVESLRGASVHPITYLIENVRRIFLELGFSEIKGHYVEYAGWNMDALFIPQHHPARDMQDTFYVEVDRKLEFENQEILPAVKIAHENGIKGYRGWGYPWSEDEARRTLLRTHTTVNTIRYLYNHKEPPVAVFSIEKAFRHESVDWTHLAELHQIEGVFYGKEASVSSLKWLIKEFYSRLGFKEVRLIPSYYPYTEPSMDVVAIINGKEVEMGGSGLFRPEVTVPLGLKEPVIAWGLGLERLAMMYFGISDIREIYNSDLKWLQSYRFRS
ncbi:MAG: phenylalanine--tRNA ligase subunit alpha [Thermoplasmataceae archaeon]